MSSNKSLRKKFSRKTKSSFDVDITSLLDILIILLFFLLKNYNTTGVLQSIPKEIALPFSESSTPSINGVLVQASKNSIWVDDKKIYENKSDSKETSFPLVAGEIIPLYDELVKKREKIQQLEEVTEEAQKFTGLVSLVVEKSLRYSEVKKLMSTCASAGFMKFKLSVNSY